MSDEYEDEMEEHHPHYGEEEDHLSECAISMGWDELGCTCYDDSPEWTT